MNDFLPSFLLLVGKPLRLYREELQQIRKLKPPIDMHCCGDLKARPTIVLYIVFFHLVSSHRIDQLTQGSYNMGGPCKCKQSTFW